MATGMTGEMQLAASAHYHCSESHTTYHELGKRSKFKIQSAVSTGCIPHLSIVKSKNHIKLS
jgi:hypothetical protein